MPKKSKRGRRPGQLTKRFSPGMHFSDIITEAHNGTFDWNASGIVRALRRIAKPAPRDRHPTEDKLARQIIDLIGPSAVWSVVERLADAVSRRDGELFRGIARVVEAGHTGPAEPLYHCLAKMKMNGKDGLSVGDIQRTLRRDYKAAVDERAIRRAMAQLGMPRLPRGNPHR